jgi:hypothetical protein
MSTAWQSAGQTQSLSLRGVQAVGWVQKQIRSARLLGAVRPGSLNIATNSTAGAAIVLWKEDSNNDGFIQGYEVEMIEHNPLNHTLLLYPVHQGDQNSKWQWTVFTDANVCDQFKIGRSAQVIARNVYGASFAATNISNDSLSPSMQFALKFVANESSSASLGNSGVVGADSRMMVEYGAATIRAPVAQPSY